MNHLEATVLITTKNRREELRAAVRSALAQTANVEVLVIDDGSTDDTAGMIRADFPMVRLERSEQSLGLIVQRNRGARLAAAPIVFSIDDDAAFDSARTVEQTLGEFSDPRIGAVAIPYIDVSISPEVRQRAPDGQGVHVAPEYRGTAHALRRELFVALGGYRETLFHQCEEGDYCVRMLAAGYVTRLGRADPIHHFESPRRDLTRMITYNARNHILFAWHNVPMAFLPAHLAGTTLNILRYGFRTGYVRATIGGLTRGFADVLRGRARRQALSYEVYRLHRWLKSRAPLPFEQVEPRLPAPIAPPHRATTIDRR